jgi:predicted porin
MKFHLHAFAAIAAALVGSSALAQSSVTVYGRLNLSLEHQKTDAGTNNVEQNNSSRIGFKGTEDLGGGMKAGFQLESGVSADTGAAAGTFWGRQSEVNLSGSMGTLRLGNFTSEAYYASADYISMHNHDTGTSSDALYAYVGRNTNKVAYRAPEFIKGLSLEGAVSLKEAAAKNTVDFAANYANGPLQLGAGYEKNGEVRQFAVRGLYELGSVTLGAYVQQDKNAFAAGSRTNVRVSAMYAMGATEFHVNVGAAGKTGSVANSSAKQGTLGVNYNLSKRTKVYAFYTKVDDNAAALYGGDFSSLALGVRHNF